MELTPPHSYRVSLATLDNVVLPATRHKWTHPDLTPARPAGTPFTYLRGIEGWVDLGDLGNICLDIKLLQCLVGWLSTILIFSELILKRFFCIFSDLTLSVGQQEWMSLGL